MDDLPKIYFWPNLMTAGNLCCGFFATLSIFPECSISRRGGHGHFYQAIGLILARARSMPSTAGWPG